MNVTVFARFRLPATRWIRRHFSAWSISTVVLFHTAPQYECCSARDDRCTYLQNVINYAPSKVSKVSFLNFWRVESVNVCWVAWKGGYPRCFPCKLSRLPKSYIAYLNRSCELSNWKENDTLCIKNSVIGLIFLLLHIKTAQILPTKRQLRWSHNERSVDSIWACRGCRCLKKMTQKKSFSLSHHVVTVTISDAILMNLHARCIYFVPADKRAIQVCNLHDVSGLWYAVVFL